MNRSLLALLFSLIPIVASVAQEKGDDKPGKKVDVVMTRTFDSPIEKVWKAWSDAKLVMQWWGPTGFTCPVAKMDFRKGGTSLVCMRAPKEFGGQDMYSTWKYTAIEPMKRIEYIHNLADNDGSKLDPAKLGLPADFPQDQRHVVTFKALGDNKTEMTITEFGYMPGQLVEMAKMGLGQCLDKMAVCLGKD